MAMSASRYVVGCLWNSKDSPPKQASSDPLNKRTIRTPKGHEFEFDDLARTVTLTSADSRRIVLGPKSIELAMDADKTTAITLEEGQDYPQGGRILDHAGEQQDQHQ